MAVLIVVHEGPNRMELLLNADQIAYARPNHDETTPCETTVTLVERWSFHIRETIPQLQELVRQARLGGGS